MINMDNEDIKKTGLNIVTDLAKPIYTDALQPSAKVIGNNLEIVAKTVGVALAPLKLVVWGYDQIEKYLSDKIPEKLNNISPEKIQSPPIEIAGPAIEALRYTTDLNEVRELYVSLIANSMNIDKSDIVHPSYIHILKNLSSDEAKILPNLVKYDDYKLLGIEYVYNGVRISYLNNYAAIDIGVDIKDRSKVSIYIDNFLRLGIIKTIHNSLPVKNNRLEISKMPYINDIINDLKSNHPEFENISVYPTMFPIVGIKLTDFGKNFINSIINS